MASINGRSKQPVIRQAVLRSDGYAQHIWKEIEEVFGLTRQQARYAYQKGKREERRAERRSRGGRRQETDTDGSGT